MTFKNGNPRILLYSLILPFLWFSVGLLMDYILPGKSLGVGGLVIIIYATIAPISWHFAKTFRRHLSNSEKIRLALYLTIWAVLAESLTLMYHLSLDSSSPLPATWLFAIFGFTFAMDALFMWLGVTIIATRMISHFLNKLQYADTCKQ